MTARYASALTNGLRSAQVKNNDKNQHVSVDGPRRVEICSFDTFCTGSAWNYAMQMSGCKIIIYEDSSSKPKEVILSFKPHSICHSDHCIFIVDESGKCHIWSSLDQLLLQPEDPQSMIDVKSVDNGKLCAVYASELQRIAVTKSNKLFRLHFETPNWNARFLLNFKFKIKDVKVGKEHFLFLSDSGVVFSCGLGSRGQLGHGDTEEVEYPKIIDALHGISITSIACGGWHSAAVSEIGDVYTWGWNESGQVGCDESSQAKLTLFIAEPYLITFPSDEVITKVCCGSRHTIALSTNGSAWSWGWNHYRQLCVGDDKNRSCPSLVPKMPNEKINDIHCIAWTTFLQTVHKDAQTL